MNTLEFLGSKESGEYAYFGILKVKIPRAFTALASMLRQRENYELRSNPASCVDLLHLHTSVRTQSNTSVPNLSKDGDQVNKQQT